MGKRLTIETGSLPNDAVAVDISSVDYDPGHEFLLYVGTGGTIYLDLVGDGANMAFVNVPSGSFLPMTITKVVKASTTASNMVALY